MRGGVHVCIRSRKKTLFFFLSDNPFCEKGNMKTLATRSRSADSLRKTNGSLCLFFSFAVLYIFFLPIHCTKLKERVKVCFAPSSSIMNQNDDTIMNNLGVIGSILQNDKLMTNSENFDLYVPTTVRGAIRKWYGESRADNVRHIRHVVSSGMQIAKSCLDEALSFHDMPLQVQRTISYQVDALALRHFRVCDALNRCVTGLQNLMQTYRDDANTCSNLRCIHDDILNFLTLVRPLSERLRCSSRVDSGFNHEKIRQ